jgi:hypothetical protein
MEALGIVLSFICRQTPYSEFRAAKILRSVQHQLSSGCHVCLIEDEQLVAYAGWLPVDPMFAQKWLEGKGTLQPVPSSSTDAAALTVVSVTRRTQIPQIIRACRDLAPQSDIYFKREYPGGRAKKSKVQNRK